MPAAPRSATLDGYLGNRSSETTSRRPSSWAAAGRTGQDRYVEKVLAVLDPADVTTPRRREGLDVAADVRTEETEMLAAELVGTIGQAVMATRVQHEHERDPTGGRAGQSPAVGRTDTLSSRLLTGPAAVRSLLVTRLAGSESARPERATP